MRGFKWQFACTAVPLDLKAGLQLSFVCNAIIATVLQLHFVTHFLFCPFSIPKNNRLFNKGEGCTTQNGAHCTPPNPMQSMPKMHYWWEQFKLVLQEVSTCQSPVVSLHDDPPQSV